MWAEECGSGLSYHVAFSGEGEGTALCGHPRGVWMLTVEVMLTTRVGTCWAVVLVQVWCLFHPGGEENDRDDKEAEL